MLLCPSCAETLKKDNRHGEGVWYCPDKNCGMKWFILNIPTPKYLRKDKKRENKHL